MNGEKSRSISHVLSCEGGSVTRCINRISKQSINESFHGIHQNAKSRSSKFWSPQQHWRVVQLPKLHTSNLEQNTDLPTSFPNFLGKKKSMAMTSTSCCTSCARSSKQISNSRSSLRSKLWSHVFHKGQEEMDEAGGNRKKTATND